MLSISISASTNPSRSPWKTSISQMNWFLVILYLVLLKTLLSLSDKSSFIWNSYSELAPLTLSPLNVNMFRSFSFLNLITPSLPVNNSIGISLSDKLTFDKSSGFK